MDENEKKQMKRQAKRLFNRIKSMQESGEMDQILEQQIPLSNLVGACRDTQLEVLERCACDLKGEQRRRFISITEEIEHKFNTMRLDSDLVSLKDYKVVFAMSVSDLDLQKDSLCIFMLLWSTMTLNKLLNTRDS